MDGPRSSSSFESATSATPTTSPSMTPSSSATSSSSSSGLSSPHKSERDEKRDAYFDDSGYPGSSSVAKRSSYRKPPPSYDAVVAATENATGPVNPSYEPLVDRKAEPVVLAWHGPSSSPESDVHHPENHPDSARPSDRPPDEPGDRPKAKHRRTSSRPPPNDLDRIDELDETDPLGLLYHHDGPYQAIPAVLGQDPAEQVDTPRGRKDSRSVPANSNGGVAPPRPPRRSKPAPSLDPSYNQLSLNLKPGQILPRTFYQPSPPQVPIQLSSPQFPLQRAPATYPPEHHHRQQVPDPYMAVNAHLYPAGGHPPHHRHPTMPVPTSRPDLPRAYRVPPPTPEGHGSRSRPTSYFESQPVATSPVQMPSPDSVPFFAPPPPQRPPRQDAANLSQTPVSPPHSLPSESRPPVPLSVPQRPSPNQPPPTSSRQRVTSAPPPPRNRRPQPPPPPPPPPPEAPSSRRYVPPSQALAGMQANSRPHGPPPDIHLPPPSVQSSSQSGLAPSHIPRRLVMPTPLASSPENTPHDPRAYAEPTNRSRHVNILPPPEQHKPKASDIPMHKDGAQNLLRKRSAPAAPPSHGGMLSFFFGSGKKRHESMRQVREPPRDPRDTKEARPVRDVRVSRDVNMDMRRAPARDGREHKEAAARAPAPPRRLSKRR
ncbi:hypothetical protein DENSPDRAFT_367961 [Dentipellis sp. KUC8613]|nr:hypothetical protein DENSPDRAFT_367961 [Dentipellis sp. KUC8613]